METCLGSCLLMVRVASQGLKYSVHSGLSLGFLKYLLEEQQRVMGEYLKILETRAEIEGIEL